MATLRIHVVPNAKINKVVGEHGGAIKIKLRAPAVEGKANAALISFLAGRLNVSFDDIKRVAVPALRHRLMLNYEAEAKGMTTDRVLAELLAAVPEQA